MSSACAAPCENCLTASEHCSSTASGFCAVTAAHGLDQPVAAELVAGLVARLGDAVAADHDQIAGLRAARSPNS